MSAITTAARFALRLLPDPGRRPAGRRPAARARRATCACRWSPAARSTYAALDYAASAPALQRVWDDVAAYAPYYGSVHRGAGYLSQLSTDLFEQQPGRRSRSSSAAAPDDQVVFTRSTTDSLNLLAARRCPPDTEVFVFETEHHASLLPWHARGAGSPTSAAPRSPGAGRRRPGVARSPTGSATGPRWSASPARPTSPASCGRSAS